MLRKLMKHEFKQTGKLFWPLFAGLMALVLVTALLMGWNAAVTQEAYRTDTTVVSTTLPENVTIIGGADGPTSILVTQRPVARILGFISNLFLFLFVLAVFAFIVVTFISCVMRFYKNLLGDEGYLMFTLPVTAGQNITAKLVTATAWTTGAAVLFLASVLIIVGATGFAVEGTALFSALSALVSQVTAAYGWGVLLLPLWFLLLMAAGIAATYLMLYLAMAIGAQWMQNRLLASVVAFFCLQTALQIISFVGMMLSGFLLQNQIVAWATRISTLETVNPFSILFTVTGIGLGVCIVTGAVFFAVTRWLLTKKLNLA